MRPYYRFACHFWLAMLLMVAPTLLYAQNSASTIASRKGKSLAPNNPAPATSNTLIHTNSAVSAAPGITDYTDAPIYSGSSDDQSEVHLSINPHNPSILVSSFNTYVTSTSTYSQSHFISTTSGSTWSGSDTYDIGNPSVGGDPSTAIDANGNIFISTISGSDNGYYVIKSTNNSTFGSSVFGGGQSDFDKEMIVADNLSTSPYKNNLYAAWTEFIDPPNDTKPIVRFNKSTNGGTSFSPMITLKNGPGQGTNVQTGPNGEVYVCYADYGSNPVASFPAIGFGFVKSTDGGSTFTASHVAVSYTGIRKLYTVNGHLTFEDPNFNYTRVNDYPSMSVDKSGQAHNGRVYVVFAAQQNGNGKAVIEMCYSDNQGTGWSTPKVISISNATESFFPWVAVDQKSGGLYIAYYAIDGANFQTNTYLAISNDGGSTFVNQLVSDVPHTTQPINNGRYSPGYAGDYIGVTAYGGKAYVGWMDERTNVWQAYVSEVDNLPAITGSTTAFCTPATFSVSNVPPGQTVTWSSSPTGIVSLSPSGNSVTATKIGLGSTNLIATTSAGVAGSLAITTVPQIVSISSTMSGPCTNGYQSWYLVATPNIPGPTWQWSIQQPTNGTFIIQSPNSPATYVRVKGGGTVLVNYTDACGDAALQQGVTIYAPCQGPQSVAIFPNPANNQLTVQNGNLTTQSEAAATGQTKYTPQSYSVQLLDITGKVLKSGNNSNGNQNIVLATSDLSNGTYYLHILQEGVATIEKQIIVQH